MNRLGKMILRVALSLLALCAWAGYAYRADAAVEVSASFSIYDALTPYGTWENVGSYGDCWVPLDVPVGWRPYTQGYWEDTDYGWMWISQDPWGDTPYHYGRWADDDSYGWVWVPDDDEVWAPAWVAWRYGGGYVGWAPLPPDVGWQNGIGLSVSVGDLDQRISRDSWCFTPTSNFGSTRISASVLPPGRNVTLILRTQNVTRYDVYNSRPAERGLTLEILERDTGRKFQSYQVQDLNTPASPRGSVIRGRSIEVYRPPAPAAGNRHPRPSPDAQPAPSPAVIQRLDADQRQFDQRMQKERATLDREHQNELKQQGKTGAPVDQVRQQQQAELQAQQDRVARERRSLDQRRKIVQDRQRPQGQGKGQGQGQDQSKGNAKAQDQGKGNAQGQDQGKGQGKGQGQGQNQDQGKPQDKGQGGNPDQTKGGN
jgi:hypothetical protein